MREAAAAALNGADRDLQTAVEAAGVQQAMGDRQGALNTLRQIQEIDRTRLDSIRGLLAGRLAFSGLDSDASSLLDGTARDRAVLANITVGRARRGDFESAFQALDRLRKLSPAPAEDSYRNPGPRAAVASIARNAARSGDVDAFRRADEIRRELSPGIHVVTSIGARGGGTVLLRDNSDIQSLGDLARAGKAGFAVDYALALPDLIKKVEALAEIAEALAGFPEPNFDSLSFFDSW